MCKVSDYKVGGRRKKRGVKIKEQEPQVIFRSQWGSQTYSLPYWLPISFQTSPGNTSFVSWLLFPSLLFPTALSEARKTQWDMLNLVAPADTLHTQSSLQLGEWEEWMCRRDGADELESCLREPWQWTDADGATQQKQQTVGGCLCSQADNSCSWEWSWDKMGRHTTAGQKQLGEAKP